MKDLSIGKSDKHSGDSDECCCCAAARLWPVSKWWCGGDKICDLAKKILAQIAIAVRRGVREVHGDKHDCLSHLEHLVANTPRSCKLSRWSRVSKRDVESRVVSAATE